MAEVPNHIMTDIISAIEPFRTQLLLLALCVGLYGLYTWSTQTDIPYIHGLPEIPGALPITGHLLSLGEDHATVCEKWWRKWVSSTVRQYRAD